MTRLATIGFETRDTSELTTVSGIAVSAVAAKSGSYSLLTTTNNNHYASIVFTATAEIYLSLWFKIDSFQVTTTDIARLVYWSSDATLGGFVGVHDETGRVGLYVDTSEVALGSKYLNVGVWYHLELHVLIHDTTGELTLKIDGVTVASFTGDTNPAIATINTVWLQRSDPTYSYRVAAYMDDVIINNAAGGVDDTWPADVRLIPFYPEGVGSNSEFIGSDGDYTDNYALVDDYAAGTAFDTDYVSSGTVDKVDTYAMTDPTLPAGVIMAVVAVARVMKTNAAGSAQAALYTQYSGTALAGSDQDVPASFDTISGRFLTQPDGSSPWDATAVNGLEVGIKARGDYS